MKHAALIAQNIVNLEARLDAVLHFGDSMETDEKKKPSRVKAALVGGASGAAGIGTGLYLGKKVVNNGGNLKGVAREVGSDVKAGAGMAKRGAKNVIAHAAGKFGGLLKGHFSAIDAVTSLSTQVDNIINFVEDDNGAVKPLVQKQKPNNRMRDTLVGAGAGAGLTAGASALYHKGKEANMAKGDKSTVKGNMLTGARATAGQAKGKAKQVWGKMGHGASAIKKGAHQGYGKVLAAAGKILKRK